MKVFVTGGTGLVGSHTIRMLVERGDAVQALSRSPAADHALHELGAEPLRGDLGDDAALVRGVDGADAVVHAAAAVLASRGWDWFYATNVGPAETIARMCGRSGRRLVHISSVAVYGRARTYDHGPGTVSEEFGLDHPTFPGDHYARSKREAEQAVWRVAQETGLSAAALRPCVIYGEGDRNFAIRVARTIKRGVAPLIGDGANQLSVVYAGNVAAAVLAALDRPGVRGPFNVCHDGGITQREFIEHFARGLGVAVKLVHIPRGLAWGTARALDGMLRHVVRSPAMAMLKPAIQFLANANPYLSDKAKTELGWIPPTRPADAVERTGRWFAD